ncbi:MAG: Sec-independent protein translocase protein TatB [Sphingorhabdus sp.]
MFDIASSEFLLVALIALLVIGPKDLPNVLRWVGRWVGKARSVVAQFRAGLDDMVRQSELKDIEKQWDTENDRIMREHPSVPDEAGENPAGSDGSESPDGTGAAK